MATQLQDTRANPVTVFRQTLQTMQPEFKMALPSHISPDKFARVAQTAINNSPDLLQCERKSLLGAIVRLAQDGLLPDGREAALVKFKTKEGNSYVEKVQAMPMIYGILKKLRQSGEVAKVSAQVVFENDHFVQRLGFEEDVEHTPPSLGQSRGKVIGAYATAVLKDGTRLLEVMDKDQIEKVRSVSKAKDNQYGPWVQWYEEMARKTVMRRLSKRLPMSTDLYEQITRDDTLSDLREPQTVEHDLTPTSRLDALESRLDIGHEEGPADADRGELVTLASAKDEIDSAELVSDVNSRCAALREHLSDDDADALTIYAGERIAVLRARTQETPHA